MIWDFCFGALCGAVTVILPAIAIAAGIEAARKRRKTAPPSPPAPQQPAVTPRPPASIKLLSLPPGTLLPLKVVLRTAVVTAHGEVAAVQITSNCRRAALAVFDEIFPWPLEVAPETDDPPAGCVKLLLPKHGGKPTCG